MYLNIRTIVLCCLGLSLQSPLFAQPDYASMVDPFIGTGGHGHTYPGATVPYGMVQLSPDTRIDGSWDGCGGYHYSDFILYGFSHTHLSGTGCSDYGDILLLPFTGKFNQDKKYSSNFSHNREKSAPGYYQVHLEDDNIDVELSATTRCGMHKYLFPKTDQAQVLLDLTHRDEVLASEVHVIDDTHIEGFRRSSAWAKDQVVYFAMEFAKKPLEVLIPGKTSADRYNAKNIRCAFRFDSDGKEPVLVKVSLSAVSCEGAWKNMKSELPGWNFNATREAARKKWNEELGRIEVKGGDPTQQKIFYTALYHCMIVPNIYSDVDGQYRGRDMQVHSASGFNYYTVFSLWDTFRAWHPLMNIIDRKRTHDYLQTFLAQYQQGGLLPVWELSSNETECMIGYHAVPVMVDALMDGIPDVDAELAFTAMKKSAESADRFGLGAYMNHAYLDVQDEPENVSKTLEYAYDDWCIARLASKLGKKEEEKNYLKRAQSWKNLYDPASGFMRPRNNGGWFSPFDPYRVDNNFTEANSWQYSFFVPQDIPGLIERSGGKEKFEIRLDSLFMASTKTSGRDQADITGLIGQYAHGNEPSHHMAYLYSYIGKPAKSQERIHQILTQHYHANIDGLAGNEDCGQMSAWYVLSAMGFYSVTPGSGYFVIGSPVFPEIDIHLENGKTFIVKAKDVSAQNFYIKSAQMNGSAFSSTYISFNDIQNGGSLELTMAPSPFNQSLSKLPPATMPEGYTAIICNPVISAPAISFINSQEVNMSCETGNEIHFTNDGSQPTINSALYKSPVRITENSVLHATAFKNGIAGKTTEAKFYKVPHPDWTVKLSSNYNPQYTAGGDAGIIDGLRGNANWRKGGWQGYQAQDFEVLIDMGKIRDVHHLGAGFLQDTRSWILMPKDVSFELSEDGKKFEPVLKLTNTLPDKDLEAQVKDLAGDIASHKARFIRVKAKNYGKLPEWHAGAGGEAFIFVDEIMVE